MQKGGDASSRSDSESISKFIYASSPASFSQFCQQVPTQFLPWPIAEKHKITVYVRRDDLIDPIVGGNKLYKLWGHIQAYRDTLKTIHSSEPVPLISFGGAYSNHLYALAGLAKACGIPSVGIIRGERPSRLSPTLHDLQRFGMRLIFVSRSDYRHKALEEYRQSLLVKHVLPGHSFFIGEGGDGMLGQRGCQALGAVIGGQSANFDALVQSCGTGTTIAGLAAGLTNANKNTSIRLPQLIGISALKSQFDIAAKLRQVVAASDRHRSLDWFVSNQYHFGGFAKTTPRLTSFVHRFEAETGLVLDRVYNAKTFYGLHSMIESGYWQSGARILVMHSGGLQGNRQNTG